MERMTNTPLFHVVADAIRTHRRSGYSLLPEAEAAAVLSALGLSDMDGFIRRLHEGYFDDSGPSSVEYACMRNAVEYAFSATATPSTGGESTDA